MLDVKGGVTLNSHVGLLEHAMPRYALFAYLDGADLEDVAEPLETRFRQFARSRRWIAGHPTIINRRFGKVQITQSGVTELWRLGLTLELPEIGTELPNWFADVVAVARVFCTLHTEFCPRVFFGFFYFANDRTDEVLSVSTYPPRVGRH